MRVVGPGDDPAKPRRRGETVPWSDMNGPQRIVVAGGLAIFLTVCACVCVLMVKGVTAL